ncbi:hypothetical protein E5161_03000 [Cohnella pontilimi]|uniref:Uncharacterized protein n=1 Tax=Cohnella pontilimi TaxID=2564100 RepID=A0A4U0FH70_9BACL|nr:hypothetical protein [Cohnella pontilimi]TJY44363.1 hypothetical protein E5161_03000 [Cohnella pontilimi]
MPPGYAAFFLWTAAAILWWSGWREETADGIPERAVAVFLAGWPLTAWMKTGLGHAASVQVNGAFMWTAVAMIVLALTMTPPAAWTALSAGILAGSFAVMLSFSPHFYLTAPDWLAGRGAALVVGMMSAALCRGASGQIVAASAALCLCEGLSNLWLRESGPFVIGTERWMESWWTSVLTARLASYLASAAFRVVRSPWRRGGQQT